MEPSLSWLRENSQTLLMRYGLASYAFLVVCVQVCRERILLRAIIDQDNFATPTGIDIGNDRDRAKKMGNDPVDSLPRIIIGDQKRGRREGTAILPCNLVRVKTVMILMCNNRVSHGSLLVMHLSFSFPSQEICQVTS